MKKPKVIVIIIVSLILLLALTLAIIYISKNTHFLNFNISKKEIEENNQNPESANEEEKDLTTLVETKLNVPDKFKNGLFAKDRVLNLPKNFTISLYASGMNAPRHFVFDENNNLFITDRRAGKVFLLPDKDQDGISDDMIEVDSNLKNPHGIDLFFNDLYVAEENKVVAYRNIDGEGKFIKKETLIELPGGGHSTRTIKIGPDEKIYLSIGSSCNVCVESDSRRAAIVRYSLDGKQEKIFATGLRNTVGFIFNEDDGMTKIWGVDNGRDQIGNDIPPEEVNIIEEDKNYGWPYCYGNGIANPEYQNKASFCKETAYPKYNMQAHSAPLGIVFYPSLTNFPTELEKNIFITFHGSWNRTVPTGYKVVRIDTSSDQSQVLDFITGWLDSTGNSWGRPVGIDFDKDGDLFISDDQAGAIYKVTYREVINK